MQSSCVLFNRQSFFTSLLPPIGTHSNGLLVSCSMFLQSGMPSSWEKKINWSGFAEIHIYRCFYVDELGLSGKIGIVVLQN